MHTDLESRRTAATLLRDLPEDAAPPYGWREFQRRARTPARASPRLLYGAALATALVVLVASGALVIRLAAPDSRAVRLAPAAPPAVFSSRDRTSPRELPQIRAAEAGADRWLASLPSEPLLVRVGTRAAVTTLEDRIAQVDDLLSAQRAARAPPAHLLALQQQRLQLVDSLAQVRYAETLADASR
jgi:hypothetical protein